VVRHPLVQRIVNAYQVWEQNQEQADRNGKSPGKSP